MVSYRQAYWYSFCSRESCEILSTIPRGIKRKQFTKEIKKPKPSMMTIPFISVYKLTSRTPRSFSKIKLFAKEKRLLTFLVFPIAEDINI